MLASAGDTLAHRPPAEGMSQMVPLTAGRRWAAGRAALCVLAAGALALSAAGCGAASGATPHASHASSSQTGNAPATGGNGGAATGPLAYAACMRAHGIPDFPDPSGGGMTQRVTRTQVTINGVTLKESAAQFQTASQACQSKMGINTSGGPPNPALQKAALEFANCMRTHGVPNFPDPKVSGNGVQIQIKKSSGINPQSPQFQKARSTCQPLMAAARKGLSTARAANGGNG